MLSMLPPLASAAERSARVASGALWSVVLLAESVAFVAYKASSVVSALASRASGVILAAVSRKCWSTTVLRP